VGGIIPTTIAWARDSQARYGATWLREQLLVLATYMGHTNVTITLDRYRHMFPGSEEAARGLLDACLDGATGAQRRQYV
jgi:hypothetical protein